MLVKVRRDSCAKSALTEQIRDTIAPLHDRIEATTLAQAMLAGSLSPAAYGCLLARLAAVHEALEAALDQHRWSGLAYPVGASRSGALSRDLQCFPADDSAAGLAAALSLVDAIRTWSSTSPYSLIGCLYIFEGSRMGSSVLAPRLAYGFGLSCKLGVGLDYHLEGRAQQASQWRSFKRYLDLAELGSRTQAAVVQGAERTMSRLLQLFEDIGATSYGPEAGGLEEAVRSRGEGEDRSGGDRIAAAPGRPGTIG